MMHFTPSVTLNLFQGPFSQPALQLKEWMLKQLQHDGEHNA
jgi:hypothetical protein